MTLLQKKDLVRLLNLYQNDILDGLKFNATYPDGKKAQLDHARIIANKLSKEISDKIYMPGYKEE